VVVRIAIVDPLPMFREGAAAALAQTGHLVETPADVVAWMRRQATNVVLLTITSDTDWQLLDRLRTTQATSIVIALLDGGSLTVGGVRAVRAGARSVLWRDASASSITGLCRVMACATASSAAVSAPQTTRGQGL
jgi:DNA-binding NarL/FixJ family response regulator